MEQTIQFIKDSWWVILIKGLLLILLGISTFVWPAITIHGLLVLLAIYLMIDGAAEVLVGFVAVGKHTQWFLPLVRGLVSLAVGVLVLRNPEYSSLILFYYIGGLFIAKGIFDLLTYVGKQFGAMAMVMNIVSSILFIATGILLLIKPIVVGVAIFWLIGIFGLVLGIITLITAISLRTIAMEAKR